MSSFCSTFSSAKNVTGLQHQVMVVMDSGSSRDGLRELDKQLLL